jgi:hypothetical protein
MNSNLQFIFNKIEAQRASLLAELKALPEENLSASPAPGKWSALQILSHLYTSEKMSMAYIKKKSQGINDVGNAGLKHKLVFVLLKFSQRIPLRYKAPQVVTQNMEAMPLPQLVAQWDLLRLELKSMLENVSEKHVNRLVFKHPVAGRLSMPQAVAFFGEHIHHHTSQLKRISKS